MKYFFTSDEHYGHNNIIKYCDRPFKNSEEMDNEIIKRHNEVVSADDVVYHLGDFTLSGKRFAENITRRLNGTHIFLKGSHDYWDEKLPYIIEMNIDGTYIVMCHYAMRRWPRSHYDSIQLFGHSHGKLTPDKNQYDVGVDNNDFYPASLEGILLKINKVK